MLHLIWNWLGGQIEIRVEDGNPERVLNLCGKLGLRFHHPVWDTSGALAFRLSRKDWKILRRELEQTGCPLPVAEARGLSALLSHALRRPVLLATLVLCATALFLGSFFVWDYEITGNETVSSGEILRSLESNGVGLGAFGLALDGESIRNHVLLDIPELCWIAVNVYGCRAKVQVRERVPAPEMQDGRTPSNVVARTPGYILEVRAMDGVPAVLPGMSVTEGQLLISGAEDLTNLGTARILAGHGSVKARTWHTLTTRLPLAGEEKRYTGEERRTYALILGRRRVKIFSDIWLKGLEPGTNYDKIATRTALAPLGISIPVAVDGEMYRLYERQPVLHTAEEVQRRGEAALMSQLRAMVLPYGEIRATLCTARQKGDALEVTLSAECVEEIGVRVPIYTKDFPEQTGKDFPA